MTAMFGPQWVDKYGQTNAVWDEALAPLSYEQITAGISKIRNGGLRFFEIDLPNFLALCRPAAPPTETSKPWKADLAGMDDERKRFHTFVRRRLIEYAITGIVERDRKASSFGDWRDVRITDAQAKRLWSVGFKLADQYVAVEREIGKGQVTDAEFRLVLQRAFDSVLRETVDESTGEIVAA